MSQIWLSTDAVLLNMGDISSGGTEYCGQKGSQKGAGDGVTSAFFLWQILCYYGQQRGGNLTAFIQIWFAP